MKTHYFIKNKQRVGEYKSWRENGQLRFHIIFDNNGKKIEETELDEDGSIFKKYENNMSVWFHKNGMRKMESLYSEDGKKSIGYTCWDEDGIETECPIWTKFQ